MPAPVIARSRRCCSSRVLAFAAAWILSAAGPALAQTALPQQRPPAVCDAEHRASVSEPEFEADEFGRVSSEANANRGSAITYDDLNRVKTVNPALGKSLNYAYLRDNTFQRWITSLAVTGVGVYEFREDTKGRSAEVVNAYNQYAATRFDREGKPLQDTLPNGTTTAYAYTSRDWLAGIEHRRANGTLLDRFDYFYTDGSGTYDPTGRLQRELDAGGRTHAFAYNRHGELTTESHPDLAPAVSRSMSTATGRVGRSRGWGRSMRATTARTSSSGSTARATTNPRRASRSPTGSTPTTQRDARPSSTVATSPAAPPPRTSWNGTPGTT